MKRVKEEILRGSKEKRIKTTFSFGPLFFLPKFYSSIPFPLPIRGEGINIIPGLPHIAKRCVAPPSSSQTPLRFVWRSRAPSRIATRGETECGKITTYYLKNQLLDIQ